jgi:CheY-like chemotaxis protein
MTHSSNKKRRVLVVDANLHAAESLACMLQTLGEETEIANDGASALELAASFQPHVAILDLGIHGMSGYDVAISLRQLPGMDGMGLFALSGWNDRSTRERGKEAGFNRHFVKPTSLDQILFALSEYNDDGA